MAELAEHDHPPSAAELKQPISIDDYDALLEAVRTYIRQTNTTYSALEAMAGLPANYLVKLIGPRRTRHFGPGLFYLLASLGLRLVIVEDPQLVARYRDHLEPRQLPHMAREHWRWWKRLSTPDYSKHTNGHG